MSTRARTIAIAVAAVAVLAIGTVIVVRRGDDSTKTTAPTTTVTSTTSTTTTTTTTIVEAGYPGMPPVVNPRNIYSEAMAGHVSPQHQNDPPRVYVPDGRSNTVTIIDPTTKTVVGSFPTDAEPQHIVPSYDLSTLWLLNNQGNSVVPIDPATSQPGDPIPVDDPYNLYFTPDGASAIVVAEAFRRLDFRDPHTMAFTGSLEVPECAGMNHADYNSNGAYMLVTCEFGGKVAKIDIARQQVLGILDLTATGLEGVPPPMPMRMPDGSTSSSMPQDVRAGPDGRTFYVADMMNGGVFVIDGDSFTATQFIPTGIGAHGLTPTRDGTKVYVANRGTDQINGPPHSPGSVSVLDVATNTVVATWPVPDGGSPDMGNVNADETELWLSGRYDAEVYVFDTASGTLLARIPVGAGPHGLTVWPQSGRYSLGHTGNMR